MAGKRDEYYRASDQDEGHLGSGQNAAYGERSARKDLSAAMLVILVASLLVFGWRNHETTLNSFLDSICCGQTIAFPMLDTGITPQTLAESDGAEGTPGLFPLRVRTNSYAYLGDWSEEDRERLSVWLDLGIRFEGDWQSEELALVVDVLDAFGTVYGEERFAALAQQTVRTRSRGWRNYLTVVRLSGSGHPAAGWAPSAGIILFNNSLFDEAYVTRYYNWRSLHGNRSEIVTFVELQEIVVAHELGHVLIDGLRLEAGTEDTDILSVEGLYTRYVPEAHWPHQGASTNENLATEIGAWALDIERTPQVEEFQALVLEQTTVDTEWSARVLESTPLPHLSR